MSGSNDTEGVIDPVTTRRTLAAALGASALLAGAPSAAHADTASRELEQQYQKTYQKADRRGASPGRNIVEDGVARAGRDRGATAREVKRSLGVLRRMVPASTSAGGAAANGSTAPAAAAAAPSASTASAGLESIAACESGGDPAAVDASGTYRGKYQFDRQTWASLGGTGDPAAAPEAEQNRRAAALMAQRGSAPWPVCGG